MGVVEAWDPKVRVASRGLWEAREIWVRRGLPAPRASPVLPATRVTRVLLAQQVRRGYPGHEEPLVPLVWEWAALGILARLVEVAPPVRRATQDRLESTEQLETLERPVRWVVPASRVLAVPGVASELLVLPDSLARLAAQETRAVREQREYLDVLERPVPRVLPGRRAPVELPVRMAVPDRLVTRVPREAEETTVCLESRAPPEVLDQLASSASWVLQAQWACRASTEPRDLQA